MAFTIHSMDLKGKKIVNVEDGKILAEINDVLFDPNNNSIVALVTSKAGLFKRNTEIAQQKDIQLFGHDVVLAKHADILLNKADVSGADEWLQVSDQLRGISVLTSEGTRVGKLQDLIVDGGGKVKFLGVTDLNNGKMEEIPTSSLKSIGRDAIIVDPAYKTSFDKTPEQTHVFERSNVGIFTPQHKERDQQPTAETMDQKDLHHEEHGA